MQLFLSSYRFGNFESGLLEIVGENAQVGVITNAKDYKSSSERATSVKDLFHSFSEIGITPHEIDLRRYFGNTEDMALELDKYDFVWLAGGNTFVLRRALKYSGADTLITERVRNGTLLYGGESAGAIIATPTLKGVEFGDDPYIIPAGYADEEVWDGLGLVPFCIVPHYESGWEGDERMIDTLEAEGLPYKTLTDSQVLIIRDNSEVTE
jgi:dipeptidase E